MYKLNGHSLSKGAWFKPESQSMILTERNSSAQITLGPEAPEIGFNDWLLDETPEGIIVWRIKINGDSFDTESRPIDLEHAIMLLDDTTVFGEWTTEEIGGSDTITAKAAVEWLLSRQSDWRLGDFDYTDVSEPYEFENETILDALDGVSDTLEDCVWEYDMTVYPFLLHIRRRDTAVACEMRGGRNLQTLKRTMSRSGMYTRIYPIGKEGLNVSGDYLSKNESVYGRIDHVETDNTKSTEEMLRAWAQGRLNRHCEPEVSITISGLELSAETGETMDQLKLNRVCRCPLPEFSTTIQEKITKLQWRDWIEDPEEVLVTLCNNTADVATIIRREKRDGSSGKSGAASARWGGGVAASQRALFYEMFDECGHLHSTLEFSAESLRIHFDNLNESTRSEMQMTAESLRVQFENDISSTRSLLLMTAESLRIAFENDLSSTRSEFQMTAESMRIAFENADASLRSSISAEAGRIGLVVEGYGANAQVKSASIIAAITDNNGELSSSITIDADNVYIGNDSATTVIAGKCKLSDVTADYISGKIATIPTLSGIAASFSGNVTAAGAVMGSGVYIGTAGSAQSLADAIKAVQVIPDPNNANGYVLQYQDCGTHSGWQNASTFSRAIASWTLGWSGGTFTAKANPQNQSVNTQIVQGETSWDGNSATVPIEAIDSDNPGYQYATGRSILVDASGRYSAGKTQGRPSSGVAGGRTSGVTALVHDFTITCADGETRTLQIDVTSIYNTARSGYTLGTFTLADITLQGSSVSCYVEVSSGGTNYYQAGSAVTVYDKGTGITVYDAGTAIEAYSKGAGVTVYPGDGGEVYPITGSMKFYHVGTARHYDVNGNLIGNHDWYYSGSGTTYYSVGSKTYARGTGYTLYPAIYYGSVTPVKNGRTVYPATNGRSLTPISGSAKQLAATTRYAAGTRYQDTYYTKS